MKDLSYDELKELLWRNITTLSLCHAREDKGINEQIEKIKIEMKSRNKE